MKPFVRAGMVVGAMLVGSALGGCGVETDDEDVGSSDSAITENCVGSYKLTDARGADAFKPVYVIASVGGSGTNAGGYNGMNIYGEKGVAGLLASDTATSPVRIWPSHPGAPVPDRHG